jgi:spore germination protein
MLMVVMLIVLVSGGCARGCRGGSVPQKRLARSAGPAVLGYYENGVGGFFEGSAGSLKDHKQSLDAVAFRWYELDAKGTLTPRGVDEAVLTLARNGGVKLLASISNEGDVSGRNTRFLDDTKTRATAIEAIVREVRARKLDGVTLDLDLVPQSSRANLTGFIRDLAARLHADNRILVVPVRPRIEYASESSAAFDFRQIAAAADYVVLLAFDRHFRSGDPGPISPLDWVDRNVTDALRDVPRGQLILAVGLYAYDWPSSVRTGLTEYIPLWEADERARRYGAKVGFDEASKLSYFDYQAFGQKRTVWVQDARALRAKLDLVKRRDLAGVALWRLGFENQAVWDTIKEVLGR